MLVALTDDLSSVPSTYTRGGLQPLVTLALGDPMPSLASLETCIHVVNLHTCRLNIYTHKKIDL